MNNIDKRYKLLLDLSVDGIHVLDVEGSIVECNKSFAKMLGYTVDEIKKLNVKDFDVKFTDEELSERLTQAIESSSMSEEAFETKHIKKDGTIIDVLINAKYFKIEDKEYLFASSKDITKEKKYKEKLKKQKRELELEKSKLETIVHNIPDLLWIKDFNGKFTVCNKRFEELLGAKREQIIGKTDYDFVEKELADFFRENDLLAMNSDVPLSNFEEVTFASDGHKEFLNTTKVKIKDENGQVLGILGLAKNLTEVKKYQEEIEKEKTKYKLLIENSANAIFIVDLEGNLLECSNVFKNSLGYSDSEIKNLHVSDFEAIHSKKQIKENIEKVGFEPINFQTKYRKKDNSLFDVSVSIIKVMIDGNEVFYSSFKDISKEQKLQNNLLKQKEEFETIFNYSHDGIAIIDLDSKFLKFNKAFLNLIAYNEDELLTMNCNSLLNKSESGNVEKLISDTLNNGHTKNVEKNFITKEGKKITLNISASLHPDKNKILLNMKDISSLKMMEEQSKLASMGEMIGNIAHQWRQPLSVITTNISGLRLKSDLLDIEKYDIDICEENILKQAKYLSHTIDNFRNFIKDEKLVQNISLKSVLENALSLVHSSLHNNFINEIINLNDDLVILGNKNELAEAFINIFNNSKDALKSNIKNEEDRLLFVTTKLLNKNTISVEVLDSGLGVKKKIINKIFEPYFTTKHQSQGTGLGLLMADKIIRERHGGLLEVSNKDFEYNGKKYYGASFKITFTLNN